MRALLGFGLWIGFVPFVALGGGDDASAWKPIRIPGRQPAPEFADVDAWLHTEPLTMKQLKGKVIVVHFMAFG